MREDEGENDAEALEAFVPAARSKRESGGKRPHLRERERSEGPGDGWVAHEGIGDGHGSATVARNDGDAV